MEEVLCGRRNEADMETCHFCHKERPEQTVPGEDEIDLGGLRLFFLDVVVEVEDSVP